jgi:hypothetical protein
MIERIRQKTGKMDGIKSFWRNTRFGHTYRPFSFYK